jgi:uncharacterized protein
MKHSSFIYFLVAILVLYTAINSYIFIRARQALAGFGTVRFVLLSVLVLWMAAYPAGRILERAAPNGVARFLIVSGSVYLGVLVHAFLLIILVDLVRLGNALFHFFPSSFSVFEVQAVRITGLAVCGITALAVTAGAWNATHQRVKTYDLTIPKAAGAEREITLVAVSDLHLGAVLGPKTLSKIAGKIAGLRPDAVLLVGDTFDEDVTDAEERNLIEILAGIRSRFGSYAVLGNHEYYGNLENALATFRKAGVTVLEDQSVMIGNSVSLIGRKDRTAEQMGAGRKQISELVSGLDRGLPLILLDHQPFSLEVAQANGIDLQISGHTHHGQFFPFNWITNKVYELSWGYIKKGETHIIVSCGAGTWGPPVRTAGVSEIVRIHLKFEGDKKE